jgi:hypothetical protein
MKTNTNKQTHTYTHTRVLHKGSQGQTEQLYRIIAENIAKIELGREGKSTDEVSVKEYLLNHYVQG